MTEYTVAKAHELKPGDHLVAQIEGREIGVFYVDGEYHAYSNWCAHQAGPVCEGSITGTVTETWDSETVESELEYCREGEILNCPWHGWEYDIRTGDCLSRSKVKLPSFSVREESGEIIVSL